MGGFSYTNVKRMRAFAEAYGAIEIGPQAVGHLAASESRDGLGPQPVGQLPGAIVSQAVRQFEDEPPEPLSLLSWSANIILLERLKDPATRQWYARKAVEHGWSRAVLTVQIESRLHERSGKAITNFAHTLPPAQSDMAREVLKDPYTFDFLTLGEAAHERDLERGLVEHVQKLLLEMGAGFAFVGRQVHLEVGDEDFYLDLLFYHLRPDERKPRAHLQQQLLHMLHQPALQIALMRRLAESEKIERVGILQRLPRHVRLRRRQRVGEIRDRLPATLMQPRFDLHREHRAAPPMLHRLARIPQPRGGVFEPFQKDDVRAP